MYRSANSRSRRFKRQHQRSCRQFRDFQLFERNNQRQKGPAFALSYFFEIRARSTDYRAPSRSVDRYIHFQKSFFGQARNKTRTTVIADGLQLSSYLLSFQAVSSFFSFESAAAYLRFVSPASVRDKYDGIFTRLIKIRKGVN